MNLSPKVNLEVFLCLSVRLWSRDMSKIENEGNWWRVYIVSINKLVFLKEGKHT